MIIGLRMRIIAQYVRYENTIASIFPLSFSCAQKEHHRSEYPQSQKKRRRHANGAGCPTTIVGGKDRPIHNCQDRTWVKTFVGHRDHCDCQNIENLRPFAVRRE